MRRVNLIDYFSLAEVLLNARRAVAAERATAGNVYFGLVGLPAKLRAFAVDKNGFVASKHVAEELADLAEKWILENLDGGSFPSPEKLSEEMFSWQYSHLRYKIDSFRNVFEAECRSVDVYTVGALSLYKTSELVGAGSKILPEEVRRVIPGAAITEFDDAGRCLAFGLYTACGFHSLRGLELVIEAYLRAFGVSSALKSWNDYVQAAKKLADDTSADKRPSSKVAAMIDRMRELDRNPLMHPRDALDEVGADMLFRLSAITTVEIVKDAKLNGRVLCDDLSGVPADEGKSKEVQEAAE